MFDAAVQFVKPDFVTPMFGISCADFKAALQEAHELSNSHLYIVRKGDDPASRIAKCEVSTIRKYRNLHVQLDGKISKNSFTEGSRALSTWPLQLSENVQKTIDELYVAWNETHMKKFISENEILKEWGKPPSDQNYWRRSIDADATTAAFAAALKESLQGKFPWDQADKFCKDMWKKYDAILEMASACGKVSPVDTDFQNRVTALKNLQLIVSEFEIIFTWEKMGHNTQAMKTTMKAAHTIITQRINGLVHSKILHVCTTAKMGKRVLN